MRSTEGYGYFLIQKARSGVDMKGRVDIVTHLRCGFITVWLGLQVFTACVPRVRETCQLPCLPLSRPSLYSGRCIGQHCLCSTCWKHLLHTRICRNDFSRADLAQCQGQSMLTCSLMFFLLSPPCFHVLFFRGMIGKHMSYRSFPCVGQECLATIDVGRSAGRFKTCELVTFTHGQMVATGRRRILL